MIGPICPTKVCKGCNTEKLLICFTKNSYRKTGRGSKCYECGNAASKRYQKNNPEKVKESRKRYNEKNKEYFREKRQGGKDFIGRSLTNKSITYQEARDRKRKEWKEFAEKNPDKIMQYQKNAQPRRNKQVKEREQNDLSFKIRRRMRHRVNLAMKGETKHFTTLTLLGCSLDFFRQWLEKNFENGMNWDNYGYGPDKWNIDHNLPCASFDLTDPEQQKACFHWSNMFPMWQKHNFSKKDNIWAITYEI